MKFCHGSPVARAPGNANLLIGSSPSTIAAFAIMRRADQEIGVRSNQNLERRFKILNTTILSKVTDEFFNFRQCRQGRHGKRDCSAGTKRLARIDANERRRHLPREYFSLEPHCRNRRSSAEFQNHHAAPVYRGRPPVKTLVLFTHSRVDPIVIAKEKHVRPSDRVASRTDRKRSLNKHVFRQRKSEAGGRP